MKRFIIGISLFFAASTSYASFCGGYGYQRTLTVNASQVSTGTLNYTNFPVLISTNEVTFSTTTGSGGHLSTGYDFIISSDSACQFPVSFDTETVQNVGVSTENVWAKLDFSSSTNRTYYLTYGNSGITSYQGFSTATWDSNYVAVYHLSNGSGKDSTVNAQTLTPTSTTASTGKIDGAVGVTSTPHYLSQAAVWTNVVDNFTLSGWINPSTTNDAQDCLYNGGGAGGWGLGVRNFGTPDWTFDFNNAAFTESGATYTQNAWQYVVLVRNSGTATMYSNAVAGGTTIGTAPFTPTSGGATSYVGANVGAPRLCDASIDEVHVSTIARSVDWIKTEYNNQSSPSTFITIGPETSSGGGAIQNSAFSIIGGKVTINGEKLSIQ